MAPTRSPLFLSARLTLTSSSLRRHRSAYLLDADRVVERGQITGVAALGDRLDTAPQDFARARFRQQRHEMHACRPSHRSERLVDHAEYFALHARAPRGGHDFPRGPD